MTDPGQSSSSKILENLEIVTVVFLPSFSGWLKWEDINNIATIDGTVFSIMKKGRSVVKEIKLTE